MSTLIEVACAKVLEKVETKMISIRGALEDYVKLDKSIAAVRDVVLSLCLGTVRNYILIDTLLTHVGLNVNKLDSFQRNLLRVIAYELKFRDIPVDRVRKCLKYVKVRVNFNDVLSIRDISIEDIVRDLDTVTRLSVRYSIPKWLVSYLMQHFPETEVENMLRAFNEKAPMYIRVNISKISREELVRRLCRYNIKLEEDPDLPDVVKVLELGVRLESVEEYRKGLFYIQDKASALVGHVVKRFVDNVELVLDVCSAPGGKTMHISELYNRKVRVVALDVSYRRILTENDLLHKYGYENVDLVCANSLRLPTLDRRVDVIIVDPDCTSLGKLAHSPEVRLWIRKHHINEYARHQYKLLRSLVMKYRGKSRYLIYSTCTITLEENEYNIQKIMNEFGIELVNIDKYFSKFSNSLMPGTLRLLPHIHGTNGYFIALLRL